MLQAHADDAAASVAQARRVRTLKRAFQRELGRHPTVVERAAMNRAAVLSARAEAAAIDTSISLEDVVRIDNTASRARAAWDRLRGKRPATSIARYVERHRERQASGQA